MEATKGVKRAIRAPFCIATKRRYVGLLCSAQKRRQKSTAVRKVGPEGMCRLRHDLDYASVSRYLTFLDGLVSHEQTSDSTFSLTVQEAESSLLLDRMCARGPHR